MSFGASPSDIIIVVTFARRLYRQCKTAGDAYLDISREVRGLHTVLRHLKYEVEAPDSVLNRDQKLYARELAPVIGDCDFTLRELDELLQRYGRLANERATPGQRLWDKIKFGSAEMDQLGNIRMKLINHKTSITVFLDTIQLHETSRLSTTLDNQGGQLDVILDKVDAIAARMGQKSGSIMTTYDDDDKEVWKQFRRELVSEGFSSDVLQQHKDVLRAYIRQIDQNGLLDEMPPDPKAQPLTSPITEQWVESMKQPMPSQAPPSFDSIHPNSENTAAKELVVNEENMKFPPSMKFERAKPESGPVEEDSGRQLVVSQANADGEESADMGGRGANEVTPRLIPAVDLPAKIINDAGPPKAIPSRSPLSEPIVCTTALILADDFALDDRIGILTSSAEKTSKDRHSPSGSPLSPKNPASFANDSSLSLLPIRPKTQQLAPESAQFGTSPSRSPVLPRGELARVSPRSSSSFLAPDSQGREIPLDAKWTKVKRSLVSTEVLDQDGRRYEARPDFVAILGVLNRDEILGLAVRSTQLREARRARNQAQVPPIQPPRPPQRHVKFRRGERRSSSDSGSESEEDFPPEREQPREQPRDRERNREREGDRPRRPPRPQVHEAQTFPSASSPMPYHYNQPYAGMPVSPPPMFSPGPMSPPYMLSTPPQGYGQQPQMWVPVQPGSAPQGYYLPEEPRRRHSEMDKGKGKKTGDGKKSRWSENITAAGIGGAAASLLSVLSEAAAGI